MRPLLMFVLVLVASCVEETFLEEEPILGASYTICMSNPSIRISNVKVTPDPPRKGADVTITATGTANKQLVLKELKVIIGGKESTQSLGGVKVSAGESITRSYTKTIPFIAKSGKYEMIVYIRDYSGNVGCFKSSFTI